jgi:hypothetical protein
LTPQPKCSILEKIFEHFSRKQSGGAASQAANFSRKNIYGDKIKIHGARWHNLKNISLDIPKN